jgi:hypothetical protein
LAAWIASYAHAGQVSMISSIARVPPTAFSIGPDHPPQPDLAQHPGADLRASVVQEADLERSPVRGAPMTLRTTTRSRSPVMPRRIQDHEQGSPLGLSTRRWTTEGVTPHLWRKGLNAPRPTYTSGHTDNDPLTGCVRHGRDDHRPGKRSRLHRGIQGQLRSGTRPRPRNVLPAGVRRAR